MHRLMEFDHWLDTTAGIQLLNTESMLMRNLMRDFSGNKVCLFGSNHWDDVLHDESYKFCCRLSPAFIVHDVELIVSCYHQVGLGCESFSMVILPHVLEFSDDCNAIIQEALRILQPGGYLVILGFNPLSLWHWNSSLKFSYWHPYSMGCVERTLVQHKMKYISHVRSLYAAPQHKKSVNMTNNFLEKYGPVFWPFFGGIYALVMQKDSVTANIELQTLEQKLLPLSRLLGETT